MKKIVLHAAGLSFALLSLNTSAVEVVGTLPYKFIPMQNLLSAGKVEKQVSLMKLKFTPEELNYLKNYNPEKDKAIHFMSSTALPTSVNLGMNSAPVLDQGAHGTCVTFANSGAIDALLDKGDYVSQLCSLELGTYLESQGQLPYSGWNGSFGSIVLGEFSQYGIVSMSNQLAGKCAGIKQYPTRNATDTGHSFPTPLYKAISEDISKVINWKQMLTANQRFGHDYNYSFGGDQSVQIVKQALANYKKSGVGAGRVTFGTIILLNDRLLKQCSVGACGSYHKNNDTWAYTSEVQQAANADDTQRAGHEMVIMGYDDNASFTDRNGTKHKGLLMLRNSWGTWAGDSGNYYMTYDFFKRYVIEIQDIKRNA